MKLNSWLDSFRDPEAEYRPHPFWSWNDELDHDELIRQVNEMKKTGHGGFFMHARNGLITEYMGDEWFSFVNACADEAERLGMRAWCYDENGWPSGSAGGIIPAMGEYYQVRKVELKKYEGETKGDFLAFYEVSPDGSYRVIASPDEAAGGEVWYGATFASDNYFDILNPKVVRAFIDSTYEKYIDKTDGRLTGGSLKGFFTDEPQYALVELPWSAIIEEEFVKENGYSLIENVPALFLGNDGRESVRYDYWRLVSRLFTQSFAGQIGEWCGEHSCALTGHAMMEDNLICQIHCTAGAMPMYEYMQLPGIDYLSRYPTDDRVTGRSGNPVVPLQLGSVCAQLGKKHAISEMFAMAGWDFSFAEMRHLAEWQFLYGVNLICQHLEGYSLRGDRKNDYPPSMFYQSPWWSEYKLFNDTMSRLGKMLADGKNDPDVLMIHPMRSLWLKYTKLDMNAETDFDNDFARVSLLLDEAHVPYHYGDEEIMRRHASVDGDALKIGLCTYHTVFLPSLYGLDGTTLRLLLEFAENGGRIVSLGSFPTFVDGRPSDEPEKLKKYCTFVESTEEEIGRYVKNAGLLKVSIENENGEEKFVRYTCREYEDGRRMYLFLNYDRTNTRKVRVTLPESSVAEVFPDDMSVKIPEYERTGGGVSFDLSFEPMASHVIVTGDGEAPCEEEEYNEILLNGGDETWRITEESDDNCFILDYCEVMKADGTWDVPRHVWLASRGVMGADGLLPCIRYSFDISAGADVTKMADVKFVSEVRLPAKVTVNGTEVPEIKGEWWLDHGFTVYGIGEQLKHGRNEITVSDFNGKYEFGNGYLTGNFGVFSDSEFVDDRMDSAVTNGPLWLGDRPTEGRGGTIITQGYPFFRGKMGFERKMTLKAGRTAAVLKRAHAALSRIGINGKYGKVLAWGEMRDDVTDRIRDGENTVQIMIVTGNRNLLGPHHAEFAESSAVGPGEFIPERPSRFKKSFAFVKTGI